MAVTPVPSPHIEDLPQYIPGTSGEGEEAIKLSSNENPLGASPNIATELASMAEKLATYPEDGSPQLRAALAAKYGLDIERIICSAGSDEVFRLLCHAYLAIGDNIVQTRHGFSMYHIFARGFGAEIRFAEETVYSADIEAILDQIDDQTKIVFLANPNNPTGSYLPYEAVKQLHARIPENTLLVLDGAYAEYVQANDYAAGIELVSAHENVIMTRTFSKIHGLAALRIGWAYASRQVIGNLNKVRSPFNVNAFAQAAAMISLSDQNFIDESVRHNQKELVRMTEALTQLGYDIVPSVANFYLIDFHSEKTANNAFDALATAGLITRKVASYGLGNHLRITVGTESANDKVIATLKKFKETA